MANSPIKKSDMNYSGSDLRWQVISLINDKSHTTFTKDILPELRGNNPYVLFVAPYARMASTFYPVTYTTNGTTFEVTVTKSSASQGGVGSEISVPVLFISR